MLFNSTDFLFVFLPAALLCSWAFGPKLKGSAYKGILLVFSLYFYAYWKFDYLSLLLLSILFNYSVGSYLQRNKSVAILRGAILINLGTLFYFKYTNFFIDSLNAIGAFDLSSYTIVLPLAISFYTFQQIAYVVDSYKGNVAQSSPLDYAVFVSFFPQLIAGPIVSHKVLLTQLKQRKKQISSSSDVAVGITIFVFGLSKKILIADNLSPFVNQLFAISENGSIGFYDAWFAAIGYSMQLYFDFSGYSDMAIGLARMFGIILPVNFFSPYKARSIIDFWRRWHITLSDFLKNYLYIPLGGNQLGPARKHLNLMTTMLLGGLWHGAGWNFVLWGGLHGSYLVLNHGWRFIKRDTYTIPLPRFLKKYFSTFLTFFFVVIAWVLFRATTLDSAYQILLGAFGFNGIYMPELQLGAKEILSNMFIFDDKKVALPLLLFASLWAWFAPNTIESLRNHTPVFEISKLPLMRLPKPMIWRFSPFSAVLIAVLFIACVLSLSKPSEFLYFQF